MTDLSKGARVIALPQNLADVPSVQGFDPKLSGDLKPQWLGARRPSVSMSESVRWHWPIERNAQYQAFDDWFDIAAQIIHREGAGFRLLALYKLVINWKRGNIWHSDAELAKRAGRCSEKSISRDVTLHKRLGIIQVAHGARNVSGQNVKTRTIGLSVPDPLPMWIDVGSLTTNMDTRGPDWLGVIWTHVVRTIWTHVVRSPLIPLKREPAVMSQLDLFLHAKPTGRIFRFPSDHRVTFAHTVAQRLSSLDHDDGKKLWQDVCKEVRQGLRSEGRTASDIKGSIDRLADEVHDALKRLAVQKQYRSPAVILPLPGHRLPTSQHGGDDGTAGVLGRGTKFLVGLGEAHERSEYDAARAQEGGAA